MIRKRKRTVQYQVFQPNGRKKTITVKVGGTKTESTSPCSTLSPPACKIPEPSVPIAENKNKKSRDYNETKQSRITEWTRVMPLLTKAQLESFCPTTNDCSVCHQQLTEKFRCIDCMRDPVCLSCLQAAHGRPHLHIFEGWKNGTYLGYDCETPTWKRESHECNSLYSKTLAVVDSLGRQHKRTILFCRCEPEAVTLVRHQLWPSSPKNPTIAFDFELMKWFYGLLLEGHLSLRSFVTALSTPQSKHEVGYTKKEILNVYKVMVTETTEQFRYFWYQQQYGDVGQIKLDNGTECPACFKMDTKVFSMDADFQLVRKNSSGKSWEQPKHSGQFFLEQESVDSFISSLQSTAAEKNAQPVHDCHEFQAGNALRSKVKNSKLSETAVFGSVCRHEFPHAFFSLRHGERLGYPIFLLQHILQTHPVHTKIHVTYDIACVLEKHLKV
ncbi:uncharacterized protein LOC134262632 [Saccostrea cucullata]|uniref:uncharacterized protein LOC134262632 n=1 Tax=Saccostrea cuccullata TaxID=36930 RepID=UPI002ED2B954